MDIKLYHCKWFKADIDDLSKDYWCNNPDCPTKECWCDTGLETSECPCFERSDEKPVVLDYTQETVDYVRKEFKERIRKDCQEKYTHIEREINRLLKLKNSVSYVLRKLDCEYDVGYDDYKTENGEMKFFTVICNTFDRLEDAEKYRDEQQKRMPNKALWIQIKKKG